MIQIEDFLKESVEAARLREQRTFDDLLTGARGRVVLFGAGSLGQKVLRTMHQHGVFPMALADNDPRMLGKSFDGTSVYSLDEAIRRWGRDALFVVTIFRPLGNEGMPQRLAELRNSGCAFVTSFLPAAWKWPELLPHYGVDLPSRILGKTESIDFVSQLWSDAGSREVFRQQLAWRLHADFSAVENPTPQQYFPNDILLPLEGEAFLDGGAFDGDTLRRIPWHLGMIWAFEPDPISASRLRPCLPASAMLYQAALGECEGIVPFNSTGTPSSARSYSGSAYVPVLQLDTLFDRENPTFIKLDIEGDEMAALRGARNLLRRAQPVVAVCLYHRPEHLWEIPRLLGDLLPGHGFYLRVHEYDGFELVLYAIPPKRRVSP